MKGKIEKELDKIYVDAAPNFWERIISSEGKKDRGKEGYRYAITDFDGNLIETGTDNFINSQAEAEAWGILKATKWAIRENLTEVKIFNDCKFIVEKDLRGGNEKAKNQLYLAEEIAQKNNLKMELVYIAGSLNKADYESRVIRILPSKFNDPKFWFNPKVPKPKYKYIFV